MAIIPNDSHKENSAKTHLANLSNPKHNPISDPVAQQDEHHTEDTIDQTDSGAGEGRDLMGVVGDIEVFKEDHVFGEPAGGVSIDRVL